MWQTLEVTLWSEMSFNIPRVWHAHEQKWALWAAGALLAAAASSAGPPEGPPGGGGGGENGAPRPDWWKWFWRALTVVAVAVVVVGGVTLVWSTFSTPMGRELVLWETFSNRELSPVGEQILQLIFNSLEDELHHFSSSTVQEKVIFQVKQNLSAYLQEKGHHGIYLSELTRLSHQVVDSEPLWKELTQHQNSFAGLPPGEATHKLMLFYYGCLETALHNLANAKADEWDLLEDYLLNEKFLFYTIATDSLTFQKWLLENNILTHWEEAYFKWDSQILENLELELIDQYFKEEVTPGEAPQWVASEFKRKLLALF